MSGKKGIEAQDRRQGKRTVRSSVQVERTYPSPSYFILSVICANVAQNYLVHERLIYLPTMYSVHMTLHRFHIIISSNFPCFLFGCSVSTESRPVETLLVCFLYHMDETGVRYGIYDGN